MFLRQISIACTVPFEKFICTKKWDEVELCTLDSLVINEFKNDVAFKAKDDRLIVMVEH